MSTLNHDHEIFGKDEDMFIRQCNLNERYKYPLLLYSAAHKSASCNIIFQNAIRIDIALTKLSQLHNVLLCFDRSSGQSI